MYSSDTKKCAQQIVKEFFADILIGEFRIPSQAQMESYLLENIDYGFDEYQTAKKIQRSHLFHFTAYKCIETPASQISSNRIVKLDKSQIWQLSNHLRLLTAPLMSFEDNC